MTTAQFSSQSSSQSSPQSSSPANRIVVGVDGSEPSRNALQWAGFLAQASGSTIEVIAVWQPFTTYGSLGEGWVAMPTDWNPAADAEKVVQASVDEVFGSHRPLGLQVKVVEGTAAKVLLEMSTGAQMLIVGSRGHGGFAGLLLGSVSAACAEHAICPVLVLHGATPPPVPGPTTASRTQPAPAESA